MHSASPSSNHGRDKDKLVATGCCRFTVKMDVVRARLVTRASPAKKASCSTINARRLSPTPNRHIQNPLRHEHLGSPCAWPTDGNKTTAASDKSHLVDAPPVHQLPDALTACRYIFAFVSEYPSILAAHEHWLVGPLQPLQPLDRVPIQNQPQLPQLLVKPAQGSVSSPRCLWYQHSSSIISTIFQRLRF